VRADPRSQAYKLNTWASKATHARFGIKAVPMPVKIGEAKEKNKATNGGSVADALHGTEYAGETG
jgi:hypothetical protein